MRRREFITLVGGTAVWPLAGQVAGRAHAAHRHTAARSGGQSAISGPPRGIPSGAGAIGLDHRPQRADRHALGRGQCRRNSQTRGGIGRICAGHDFRPRRLDRGDVAAGDPHRAGVFPAVADPVGGGYVDSLARPGGNATGFMNFEYSIGGKWLELLKEIAPAMSRVAVIRDVAMASGIGQFAAIQAVAPSLGVEVAPFNLRDAGEIERAVAAFARSPNGGLIVTASRSAHVHHILIVKLAAQHKLPAVYSERFFVAGGGLISYGPDFVDQYRRAAGYVDRVLRGEKPADLPVQAPTRYEMVLNLKTAKALGLDRAAVRARPRRRDDRMKEGARQSWRDQPVQVRPR